MKRLLLIGSILLLNYTIVYALPINPGKTGQPVFLGDPSCPSTYTGTMDNPLKVEMQPKIWQVNSQASITISALNGTASVTLPVGIYKSIRVLGDNFAFVTIKINNKEYYGRLSNLLGWIAEFNFGEGIKSATAIEIMITNEIDRPQTFYICEIYVP